ncbi:MAG: NAD(P)-binding domain-containing protein [Deltaproteobacteria bacterium]|nr:NAD(P)-binding domain-containing protein [Deltaproteobacteria bacterium]
MRTPRRLAQTTVDFALFALASVAVAAVYLHASGFYETAGETQLDHPMYEAWRSAGPVGRWLGTVAVVAFVANLAYLLRRRLRSWQRMGALRDWMSAHVFFGILGGGLVLLHATFRTASEAGRWSAWAVAVLVATGVIGRYLYALVPHTASGQEDAQGLRGRAEAKLAELRAAWPDGSRAVDALAELAHLGKRASVARGVALLLSGPVALVWRWWRVWRWQRHCGRASSGVHARQVQALALEVVALSQAVQVAATAAWVLRRWRAVHLLAAGWMAWATWLHVRSALAHGYRWPLPGPIGLWGAAVAALVVVALVRELWWRRTVQRGLAKARPKQDGPPPEPPPTLHPWVDPSRCMASAACVASCPEGDILALVEGRGRLDEPSHCIGHGACAANCPVEAISLVFGSLKRGADIPDVSPTFQASVPGIYLAGELTGMGLIRNAVEQARQAVGFIADDLRRDQRPNAHGVRDLCIVGAGPAGFSAALAALERKIDAVTLEQADSIGGAIRRYPRRKLVMTAPMRMPLHGSVAMYNVVKEDLVAFIDGLHAKHRPPVEFGAAVDRLDVTADGFVIGAGSRTWQARRVLLCLGRRGTPIPLVAPGADQAHVVYELGDPDAYRGRQVAVLGGGDSALEAALAIAQAGAAKVWLVHRRDGFDRARAANRDRLSAAVAAGQVSVRLSAEVAQVGTSTVTLTSGEFLHADDVVVAFGGSLPTALLRAAGARTRTHFGRPMPL